MLRRTPSSAQHDDNIPALVGANVEYAYAPMVELLGDPEANGFSNYIASGGGRDINRREISRSMYGITPVTVSSVAPPSSPTPATNSGGTITHKAEADYLDDGPEKRVRICSRVGCRPLFAAGTRTATWPMLEVADHAGQADLRLLVLHDDAEREFDYVSGAEQALEQAKGDGWTLVSIRNDWSTVF